MNKKLQDDIFFGILGGIMLLLVLSLFGLVFNGLLELYTGHDIIIEVIRPLFN
jgi:hypothetical protein